LPSGPQDPDTRPDQTPHPTGPATLVSRNRKELQAVPVVCFVFSLGRPVTLASYRLLALAEGFH